MRTPGDPPVNPNDIRHKYLEFFRRKNHLIHPSASLKSDDPGLMFNIAGMQQFKPYFQGATPRFPGFEGVWPRVTTAQKIMRAGGKDSDIENVGRTRRHHTFFEMLGNFSFGDYFKREAILWAWEFLTSPEWLGLEPERLYATVFTDDDEAYNLWRDEVGLPESRLSRWDEAENFWPANAIRDERSGPCGPCSEIFYDRGPAYGSADETGPNTGSGDRYMEIWNLVFTQFDLEAGVLIPLPQKNIDTGSGFERVVTIVSGAQDAYGTELFQPTIRRLVTRTGVPYRDLKSIHHRIIADHIRAVTFAISDGIPPANDGAGYVIKMLIRRASRQAYLLGLREPVLHELVAGVVEAMQQGYPELAEAQGRVQAIVKSEEEQFLRTLGSGIVRIGKLLDDLEGDELPGEVVFDLWQTYGFPLDLTQEIAQERGVRVERAGYERARQQAREVSRADREVGAVFAGRAAAVNEIAREHGETTFVGYEQLDVDVTLLALLERDTPIPQAKEGGEVSVVLDRTPFYAEGGGQVGDAGVLEWGGGKAAVYTTQKGKEGLYLHRARVLRGTLTPGQRVRARVDVIRAETEKHHSATHLLHAALRSVLGSHVAQAGSLVEDERLRFDFSHPQAMIPEELRRVEGLVNRWIQTDFVVTWRVVGMAEARAAGAMMLFGEKYGERVRMVSIGDTGNGDMGGKAVSVELCGGTHVARSGQIGGFIISAEEAVSAGVRRIEARCGASALHYTQALREGLAQSAKQLGTTPSGLPERLERLQTDLKAAQRESAGLRDKLAAAQTSGGASREVKEAAGFRYSTLILEGLDASALRNAADTLLQRADVDLVMVASDGRLVTKVAAGAQTRGLHAGRLLNEVARRAGGRGGGKPDLAQGGVEDMGRLEAAFVAIPELLSDLVAS